MYAFFRFSHTRIIPLILAPVSQPFAPTPRYLRLALGSAGNAISKRGRPPRNPRSRSLPTAAPRRRTRPHSAQTPQLPQALGTSSSRTSRCSASPPASTRTSTLPSSIAAARTSRSASARPSRSLMRLWVFVPSDLAYPVQWLMFNRASCLALRPLPTTRTLPRSATRTTIAE